MFYGIIGVTGIAFVCSTELIPEINEQMKLVKFTDEFKATLTTVMLSDYAGCYLIEIVLKRLFSDFRPRDIAERRPDQIRREKVRLEAERRQREEKAEKANQAQVEALEKKIEDRRKKIQGWAEGKA